MDFQELSLNPGDRKYVKLANLPSVMSFSYISDFDFKSTRNKNMGLHNCTPAVAHVMESVDLLDFVPGLHTSNSQHVCDFSKTFHSANSANNMKKFESYSHFSTMNVLPYLVGGFVGSKSQVGVMSMQGDRFQIWDLVWQKLLEIMDVEHSVNIGNNFVEKHDAPLKQSYAEVTKTKVQSNTMEKDKNLYIIKDNMRTNKTKKKQSVSAYCAYNEKSDFTRFDRKVSLQEMDRFSSSRWSNSRRKHCKKGMDKINKRDEREAARDGLEFISQEISQNTHSYIKYVSPKSIDNKYEVKIRNKKGSKRSNFSVADVCCNEKRNMSIEKNIHLENMTKTNFDCSERVSPSADDYSKRQSISSVCSVESDDSFIIFDRTGEDNSNVEVFTEICYNGFDLLQTDDDSDDSILFSDSSIPGLCATPINYKQFSQSEHNNCLGSNNKYNNKRVVDRPCKFVCSKETKDNEGGIHSSKQGCGNFTKLGEEVQTDCRLLQCRSASECSLDSEDSFITFDTIEEEDSDSVVNNSLSQYDDSYNINSWFTDYDSEEDYDGINCTIFTPYLCEYVDTQLLLAKTNFTWNELFNNASVEERKSHSKKVHFAPDEKLVSVKRLITWDYALRAARIGRWEQYARDTMRFHDRIHRVGGKLQRVLDPRHREKIWNERFAHSK